MGIIPYANYETIGLHITNHTSKDNVPYHLQRSLLSDIKMREKDSRNWFALESILAQLDLNNALHIKQSHSYFVQWMMSSSLSNWQLILAQREETTYRPKLVRVHQTPGSHN